MFSDSNWDKIDGDHEREQDQQELVKSIADQYLDDRKWLLKQYVEQEIGCCLLDDDYSKLDDLIVSDDAVGYFNLIVELSKKHKTIINLAYKLAEESLKDEL